MHKPYDGIAVIKIKRTDVLKPLQIRALGNGWMRSSPSASTSDASDRSPMLRNGVFPN